MLLFTSILHEMELEKENWCVALDHVFIQFLLSVGPYLICIEVKPFCAISGHHVQTGWRSHCQ